MLIGIVVPILEPSRSGGHEWLQPAATANHEGSRAMATTRRFDVNAIGFWFVGALCGVLLMVGITALRQQHHETPSSMVFVASSSEMAAPVGGRLGGIDNSDTVNDARTRAALHATMVVGGRLGGIASADTAVDFTTRQALSTQEALVLGGRLGGLSGSDTVNDAVVKASVSRVMGPGEGLSQFVDTSSFAVGVERMTGPGEGRNPVTQ
jgi:hypothetical protein